MPEKIAYDPLGVFADRRVTESMRSDDPMAALHQRAVDYAPGDTDLSWARTTSWRALVAAAFDSTLGHAEVGRRDRRRDPADRAARRLAAQQARDRRRS